MKTIMTWLEEAKNENREWAENALKYLIDQNVSVNVPLMSKALLNAFVFKNTPEGVNFWLQTFESLQNEESNI